MWIVEYRELIRILTISDLKVKYQSSVLGFAWSLLNPLLMMLVLYLVFNNVFKSNQDHFALYLLIGIISWRFLSIGTASSMTAIVGKPSLVTKIYIPRQVLVMSTVLSSFISSILEFLVLVPLLIILGAGISPYILLFPVIHIIYFMIVYGISLILAALYVYYRDLNQIWDVLIQIGFFLSPIVYPLPDSAARVHEILHAESNHGIVTDVPGRAALPSAAHAGECCPNTGSGAGYHGRGLSGLQEAGAQVCRGDLEMALPFADINIGLDKLNISSGSRQREEYQQQCHSGGRR